MVEAKQNFDARNLSRAELAKMIQFTNVRPHATKTDIIKHLKTCAEYQFDGAMIAMCWVPLAREVLKGSGVKVATCIGLGFGNESLHGKMALVRECVALGADEIDYEPNMGLYLSGLYDEFRTEGARLVEAAAGRPIKAMLEFGYLRTEEDKRHAVRLLTEAEVPWIKNSKCRGADARHQHRQNGDGRLSQINSVVEESMANSSSQPTIVLIGSYLVALVMDVDRIPVIGETVMARNFREAYGGKGSDMAVQAARLGAPVTFVGCIGDDDFGRAFAKLMQEEGVNTDLLKVRSELATGAGFIIKGGGKNIITIDIGANQLFSPADVTEAESHMTPEAIVLIQLEIPLETALHAAKLGHQRRATVILNPAPAHDLRHTDLSTVDILTPNETEARVCLGLEPNDPTPDVDIARQLLELGCRTVVMTLGERGSLIVTPDTVTEIPPFSFDNIVDSNGAGDSFNASLATALLEGRSLPEAARFANGAAAPWLVVN